LVNGTSALQWRRAHGVGYCPEELPRPWRSSVRQLLELTADSDEPSWPEEVLSATGVRQLLPKPLTALSKGQWRSVLLTYAALASRDLVILDEPDSGLDPGALDRLQATLSLLRSRGASVIVLSHQLKELEIGCDRCVHRRWSHDRQRHLR
jgi:ABC-type multidrug transport system ATPase subunit